MKIDFEITLKGFNPMFTYTRTPAMSINYTCIFQDDLQCCSNLKALNKFTMRAITEKISSFVCKPRNSLPYLDRITESYSYHFIYCLHVVY